MKNLTRKRTNVFGLPAVVSLSALTMVWFLWHHPVTTVIVTIVVLAAFAISARLARLVDTDLSDMEPRNRARFH